MATNIFLGYPPENIKQFIIDNYKSKDMTKVPLHFTANEDGSSVSLVCYDQTANAWKGGFIDSWCEFQYSMTGEDDDWFEYTTGQVISLNEGETVYFKCPRKKDDTLNQNKYGFYRNYGEQYHYFIMEGSIKADGNIQFLLEKTGTKMDVPDWCYSNMFQNCTSLTKAPDLPATTLADYCYYNMFSGCSSLTQAPELPATTLAVQCYYGMFQGCSSLNNIDVSFSSWSSSNATNYWLNNVSLTGTFTCPTTLPDTPRDTSQIPSGWTRINK